MQEQVDPMIREDYLSQIRAYAVTLNSHSPARDLNQVIHRLEDAVMDLYEHSILTEHGSSLHYGVAEVLECIDYLKNLNGVR
jgi:hypothetical protein